MKPLIPKAPPAESDVLHAERASELRPRMRAVKESSEPPASRRLRVLISAYACHPELGSEPGMGWQWIRHLAYHHDLWVLTEENRFAPALKERLKDDRDIGHRVQVIGIPRERGGEQIAGSLAYYHTYHRWHVAALRVARELHGVVGFDLAHQLNMIGFREPGELRKLPVPLIWGPIGGHAQMPTAYLAAMGLRGAVLLTARNAANWLQMRASPRVRAAFAAARLVVAATSGDLEAIRRLHGREAELINETGSGEVQATIRRKGPGEPLKVLWCGLMAPRKGITLALRAVAQANRATNIRFTLLGRGPAEHLAKRLASKLGIESVCEFAGYVTRDEVLTYMHDSHVLLFPSLQEGTPHAVLESLSTGLPVLCHAVCGQGDVVTESSGVLVSTATPQASVESFARAMIELAMAPDRLAELSVGAARRAAQLSWRDKSQRMSQLYFIAAGDRGVAT